MDNLIKVDYQATGNSLKADNFGMREMQQKAFEARKAQYILLKAPPASGKSRALMFIALDKLISQGLKKVIVAVPERSIASSFSNTDLKKFGFHSDWEVDARYNLCTPGGEPRKVDTFIEFMGSKSKVLICTHATLRFAYSRLNKEDFSQCLVAIDEFHHVSAEYENKLGNLIRDLFTSESVHIFAMTGSYFRGDSVPVLMPEDESKFHKVTYNYYEQLNGYKFLKSLGIGYHFYNGKYTNCISEILDSKQKTIIHIPNVNSGESEKDKHKEVDKILDILGSVIEVEDSSNIILVEQIDGTILRVADLVNDNQIERDKVITYLRNIKSKSDVDIIIALGMAKEGFDWPYCEHALTVGYRGSLTEIIQIIGRCTRDSEGKTHAQFTNLIAEPDAESEEVIHSVNNMLKAITASLLMEQVLAPNFKFKSKNKHNKNNKNEIAIDGYKETSSQRVKEILAADLTDIKASILQDPDIIKAMPGNVDSEIINQVMIPKVVKVKYPDLSDDEIDDLSQYIVIDSVLKNSKIIEKNNRKLIKIANDFINIDSINLDLINKINPFLNAYEVLSKSLTPRVFKAVQRCISAFKISMTEDEAIALWPKINNFVESTRRHPSLDALDPSEKRMAEAILYLSELKRKNEGELA